MISNNCPECGSTKLSDRISQNEIICANCGLVIEDAIFEVNPYIPESVKNRASNPYTSVAGTNNVNGRIVKNNWLLTSRQKNLRNASRVINDLKAKLSLTTNIVNEANIIYKNAVEKNLTVGRDNQSTIYASVYLACLIHQIPKTAIEITAYSPVSRKKMLKTSTLIKKELGIKTLPTDIIDYIPRFGSKLQLKQSTITKALEIANNIRKTSVISGKKPKTIIASTLYLATKLNNDPRTQRQIANATGVIEVTIRKRSKEIINELNAKSFLN